MLLEYFIGFLFKQFVKKPVFKIYYLVWMFPLTSFHAYYIFANSHIETSSVCLQKESKWQVSMWDAGAHKTCKLMRTYQEMA